MKEEWKVYIKGAQDRGEEIIKALEDLGAVNHWNYIGNRTTGVYYITHDGYIGVVGKDVEFTQIIMDNYREIKLPEKWMDGDVLIAKNGTCYKVFWKYDSDIAFYAYNMSMQIDGTLTKYSGSIWHGEKIQCFREDYRLATPSEVERFHGLLHNLNKEWDSEKKEIVEWRWKPEKEEDYWAVILDDTIIGLDFTWLGSSTDEIRYKLGNCFRTREEAEAAIKRVKKALKGE